MATDWPSSRRLVIRPPHDSAASSGWGATKTCVTRARIASARRDRPTRSTGVTLASHERDEYTGLTRRRLDPSRTTPHYGEALAGASADRHDQSRAVRQLLDERRGDGRCGGGHDDAGIRSTGCVAEAAIPRQDLHVEAQGRQSSAGFIGQSRDRARSIRRARPSAPARPPGTRSRCPHPARSARSAGGDHGPSRARHSVIRATMYGCEMVWPRPIDRAPSSYDRSTSPAGTKASRGTIPIAASTAPSRMPREASCSRTMRALAAANLPGTAPG